MRQYTIPFENVTIAAVQDLVSIKGSSGKLVKLLKAWFGMTNTSLQTAQGLRFNFKYATATITLGSGGSAPTPQPVDPGDAAAAFTCRVNDTTPSTTSGAFKNLVPQGQHNYAPFVWNFQDQQYICALNTGLVFELLSTVSGTCAYSGGVLVGEEG